MSKMQAFDILHKHRHEVIADVYDSMPEVAEALCEFVPDFEYPDYSHKVIRDVLKAQRQTAQQLFDKAVGALLAQGKKSKEEWGVSCLYHGPDGAKCAVGHLIPDELFEVEFERTAISVILSDRPRLKQAILPCDMGTFDDEDFLSEMQSVHDACPVSNWRREFQRLARKYDLKWNF